MNQKFNYTLKVKENITYLSLIGIIDEDNNLAEIAERIGSGNVIINLNHIERINSCGVRDWVNWLSEIEAKDAKIVLMECSPAIVAQINLVNNFTGNSTIQSFYAPYFCPTCDKEKVLLIEANSIENVETPTAPDARCDECDGIMEFDDMEESYFAFLKTTTLGTLPDELPEGWEEFLAVESSMTSDRRVRTKERTLRSKHSQPAISSSLPGSLPLSSLPSLPTSSLPSLPGTKDSNSGTFSSLPSFPSKDNDVNGSGSGKSGKGKNKQQTLILYMVILLFIIVVAILIFLLTQI